MPTYNNFNRASQRYYAWKKHGQRFKPEPDGPGESPAVARNLAPLEPDTLFQAPTLVSPVTRNLTNTNRTATGTNNSTDMHVYFSTAIDGPCVIRTARNVYVHAGEISITGQIPNAGQSSSTIANYRGLAFNDIKGICFIEGLHIKASEGLSEGIQTFGSSDGTFIFKNCRIEGIRSKPDDDETYPWNHPDLLQHMTGKLFMENCTLVDSVYQGLYIHASTTNGIIPEVRMRNVNIERVRRQIFWVNRVQNNGTIFPAVKQLDNVYFYQNRGVNTFPLQYDAGHTNVSYNVNSDTYPYINDCTLEGTYDNGLIAWTDTKFVSNLTSFRKSVDAIDVAPDKRGDFAPANKVGLNYDATWYLSEYYV